ncbi:hypothetical protein YOLOSWAG_300 [Erwinia phage vB_EamM_Yoloswag]|uniref:Uncharacterized protein n=1 Tax=Erwinia phage vB_EamM_Yoloswag TaxID=1958956 RepID=A0A1S6L3L6_9CAUD|nr:hypothetical protein HOR66_gp300 [Erwinia phage vB_EamM_Yoloswag]AQT28770.1 hypothetical protein YOLOSWAG_300 [Erwinia phage vB_EamM_Yoloswag]
MKQTFNERRKHVATLAIYVKLNKDSLTAFGQAAMKDRSAASAEQLAEFGMMQNRLHRFLWDEGLTAEIGLQASMNFDSNSSIGTNGHIYLHSDMSDGPGFHADFDHMIRGFQQICRDYGFEFTWRVFWCAEEYKSNLSYFVGGAHV